MPPEEPIRIFLSYSHRDAALRTRLVTCLAVLNREGLIRIWDDSAIIPGRDYADTIKARLDSSEVFLCLITQNYLESDYAYDIELKLALSKKSMGEIEVIPIILTPSDWKRTPLGKLQALPQWGRPISEWDNQDQAFQEVANGVRVTAYYLRNHLRQRDEEGGPQAWAHPSQEELEPICIERDGEKYCRELLNWSGSLIHITSSKGHGKTSLMNRLIHHAELNGCRTASICLKAIDKEAFEEPSLFKREFCKAVGNSLGISPQHLPEGTQAPSSFRNTNVTGYFQEHLHRDEKPCLLAIDNLDKISTNRMLTDDLCGLLRSWIDATRWRSSPWKRFRLIVSYTRQPEVSDINQSPFNIGHMIRLHELTQAETAALSSRYGLKLDEAALHSLRLLVGGHPTLIGKGLSTLAHGLDFNQFLANATSAEGSYREHLRAVSHHLSIPEIGSALRKLARTDEPIEFGAHILDFLYGLSYVRIEGRQVRLPHMLHRQFISNHR